MSFELGFPNFLIGKCRCTINNAYEIKTKKVYLAQKGVVLSDTIPFGWFTSSVFIPWEKVQEIAISNTPVSSDFDKKASDYKKCTLRLNDPMKMTIDLPWSEEFTSYVQEQKLFDI